MSDLHASDPRFDCLFETSDIERPLRADFVEKVGVAWGAKS